MCYMDDMFVDFAFSIAEDMLQCLDERNNEPIIYNHGNFAIVIDKYEKYDKRLLFADYRGNLLCYDSKKEAQTALNLMVDPEYIQSQHQRFRPTDMNDVMTVDSIQEVTAVIYDSCALTDSFTAILDDLTLYQEQNTLEN